MASIVGTIRRRAQRRWLGSEAVYLLGRLPMPRTGPRLLARWGAQWNTFMLQAAPQGSSAGQSGPVTRVANTPAAMAEACARASTVAGRLAALGGSEPDITAGRRRR
ncbi:hypothetical protein [Paraburkholderia bryophila]|uniref:Uncharacterized protein n=1 Tax=Paraburkholderia bryophila TaxID=420952 RepID=A0A7Y9WRS4_9BURK|nr:hypothetical protein [Paraburkholderia bryophila]NYH25990.1 hypothetical protein [Paraburkholderia bryophila]